jgi:hypothetical protein
VAADETSKPVRIRREMERRFAGAAASEARPAAE